ncbi:ATP-binding cassette transporter, partial [Schistosoma japonicum]
CGANTQETFPKKAVRDRPQAVVPWALRSRFQVSKTDTNLPSFSDSDHALVRARICLRLTGRRKDIAIKPLRDLLNDNKANNIFQEQLEKQYGERVSDCHPEAGWNDIKKAVETAMISASKVNHKARMKPWISVASTELMDARKLIPPGSEHDEERSELRRRLIKSLRNDREQWWVAKAKTMGKAAAIGNSRQLFRLIKETGIRDPN